MANYSQLKAAIADVIKTNGTQAITGQVLQDVLNSMVSVIGANYTFAGVATPATNPGTPDQNVVYLTATEGTYPNFNGIEVPKGLSLLTWNGTWSLSRLLVEQPENISDERSFVIYNHIIDQPSSGVFSYRTTNSYDALWIYVDGNVRSLEVSGVTIYSVYFLSEIIDDTTLPVDVTSIVLSNRKRLYVPDGAKLCVINLAHSDNTGGYGDLVIKRIKKDIINQYGNPISPTVVENKKYYHGAIINNTATDVYKYPVVGGSSYVLSANYSYDYTANQVYAWYNGDTFISEGFCETGMIGTSAFSISNLMITAPANADTLVVNKQRSRSDYYYYVRRISQTSTTSLAKKRTINLLLIGSSYSQDALAYVPFIINNMGVDVDVRIGILMKSSATIQDHLEAFENEDTVYTFFYFNGSSYTKWRSYSNYSIQMAFTNFAKWDIVSLQQSVLWWGWDNYQPSLNKLINDISAYVSYQIKFIWYMTYSRPASSNGGANYSEAQINAHYGNVVENAQNVLAGTMCEDVIPVGTAIQNARTIAAIKALGDYASNTNNTSGLGYLAANDGVHLQEGLPCQIAAYTFVLSLLRIYGYGEISILGETTRVTSEWSASKNIPGPHGSPIASTDENCLIAQKSVIMAVKKPFEVTDMNYIINPT